MDVAEIRQLADVEDRHWWYKERRALLDRELRRIAIPGRGLDIGSAAGGNTAVLRARGWQALAVDYSALAAQIAHTRGVNVMRADMRQLPVKSGTCDLVIAMDVLEHVEEDGLAAAEIARALRPGGTAFITVPCDMALWSAHDEAVGHVRRYTRATLAGLVKGAGLTIDWMWSWNVVMRPVVKAQRRHLVGSGLDDVPGPLNALLTSIIVTERWLPVRSLPGVSLVLRATRP